MHSLLAFDKSAEEDTETTSIRELLDFMEKPHSIGLDNIKESLRNIVQLMLELKGYDTGYSLQHLLFGEHSSLSMEGVSKYDRAKKKKLQEFWDDMREAIREMDVGFDFLFKHTRNIIIDIKEDIIDKIANIDALIEEEANNELEVQAMKAKHKKRKKLVKFKKHVHSYKEELQEANSSREVLEIQRSAIEDAEDFRDGTFTYDEDKPSKLGKLGLLGAALGVASYNVASAVSNTANSAFDKPSATPAPTTTPEPVNSEDKPTTPKTTEDTNDDNGGDNSSSDEEKQEDGKDDKKGDKKDEDTNTKPELPNLDL